MQEQTHGDGKLKIQNFLEFTIEHNKHWFRGSKTQKFRGNDHLTRHSKIPQFKHNTTQNIHRVVLELGGRYQKFIVGHELNTVNSTSESIPSNNRDKISSPDYDWTLNKFRPDSLNRNERWRPTTEKQIISK